MRIVLDTNILARTTAGPDSPARAVLRLCMEPPHLLVLSPFLLAELSRVLRYPQLRNVHGLDEEEINKHLLDLRDGSLLVLPESLPHAVVPHDREDDPAIAGQAEVILHA